MRWPVLFLLFLIPCAAWAIASPLFSVADEPAHTVKAVATWHGQLSGPETPGPGYLANVYEVPAIWQSAFLVPECYKFQRNNTPDCAPDLSGGQEMTGVLVPAGHYPPLFYVLVGWGGRLLPNAGGVYLMRMVSALFAAAFLALATRTLARIVRPGLAMIGVLLAATPMTYFLAGSINPSGFEIAAAISVWAHVLAIAHGGRVDAAGETPDAADARRPPSRVPGSLLVGLVVSSAALALTRQLSGVFLIGILVLATMTSNRERLRGLVRQRGVQLTLGGLAVAVAVGALFVISTGNPSSMTGKAIENGTGPLAAVIGETDAYLRQMVGNFGWLDTRSPQLSYYLWIGILFAMVGFVAVATRLRTSAPLLLTVAVTLGLPLIELPNAATSGLPWQGRYSLPIAVGIPLIAVVLIDPLTRQISGLARRMIAVVATAIGIANVYAFYWALRRYVVGGDRGFNIFSGGAWQPPLGSAFLVVVMAAFAAAAVFVAVRAPEEPLGFGDPAPRGLARAQARAGVETITPEDALARIEDEGEG
jgi:hypothetical protein